ncbi:DUF4440 domain-containing protein [Novosphingobium malaysiense]|uniref:DUF4440 domain-containing protein n=1 Tax=Novosphingobium malaysiense TaxID=1348853 RepID=A0A0B1ZFX3_9SPHN|nr:nuclear transport factor 2 family protein [Novosphingobium malaysiense]KHK89991.1 hypothetical protein LK12_19070 [Novosphingobium malaysiense]
MSQTTDSGAELAIRRRRATFNRAIAEGDIAAISQVLARDVMMVTGSDSAVVSGRNAQIKAWRREFSSPARAIYTRTPVSIAVSRIEPVALEQGHWQGVEAGSGKALAAGDYAAKWREVLGEWVIVAEIYATLA